MYSTGCDYCTVLYSKIDMALGVCNLATWRGSCSGIKGVAALECRHHAQHKKKEVEGAGFELHSEARLEQAGSQDCGAVL